MVLLLGGAVVCELLRDDAREIVMVLTTVVVRVDVADALDDVDVL